MDLLHPGVYVQELPSANRPIEGVSTSTAAFIGASAIGPLDRAVLVTSFAEFTINFGTFLDQSFLAHAVFQFFNNGGKKCYVVRVAGAGAQAASISIADRKEEPKATITFKASSAGVWGNKIALVITDGALDPNNEFSIAIFRDRSAENPPQPPLLLETFANLSMNPAAVNFVGRVAARSRTITATVDTSNQQNAQAGTSRSRLQKLNAADLLRLIAVSGGATETPGTDGPPAKAGKSRSGDNPNTTLPIDCRTLRIELNKDGPRDIAIDAIAATGEDIAKSIQTNVRALAPKTPALENAYKNFTCTFNASKGSAPFYELTSGIPGASSSVTVTRTSISLPAGAKSFSIEINRDGPHEVNLPETALTDGAKVAEAIASAVRNITPKRQSNSDAFVKFECKYDVSTDNAAARLLLASGVGDSKKPDLASMVRVSNAPNSAEDVAKKLGLGASNGGIEIDGSAVLRPANSNAVATEYYLGSASLRANVVAVQAGDDGSLPGDNEYKAGLTLLDVIRDVNIVAIPGQSSADVVSTGVNYCTERADCFFIGDSNATDNTVERARAFIGGLTVKSSYGAVYYPWLRMVDPTGQAADPLVVPPSGFVAGMYARIDGRRGVFKAPAGVEANVGGAVGLNADTTDTQQDFLNPIGVNVIRSFPASGIVVWGARTLATRSDPAYRYIPVRRLAIFLEQSILNGIQFAVFEPNDEPLWSALRLSIGAFMFLQFRAGAFQGKTPNDAFFVKVDSTTTTQQDIDAGRVNILVGFAPVKPAEFVLLQLTQQAGQSAV